MTHRDGRPRPSFDIANRPGCLIAITVVVDILVVLWILL